VFAGRRVSGYPREAPVYGQWRRNERAHVGQHDSRSPYIYGGHKHALSLKIFAGVMTGRQYLSGFVTFTSYQITPAWHGPQLQLGLARSTGAVYLLFPFSMSLGGSRLNQCRADLEHDTPATPRFRSSDIQCGPKTGEPHTHDHNSVKS